MPRIAQFLDLHQGHFERQSFVRKYACEVHQLVEQIDDGTSLGAESPAHLATTAFVEFHELLDRDNRFHHRDGVIDQQGRNLVANRGQRAMLNFNQTPAVDGIDTITGDRNFAPRGVGRVMLLQLAMEGCFHGSFRNSLLVIRGSLMTD